MSIYFMGIDLGGTEVKAGIYDSNGREICVSSKPYLPLSFKVGFSERDMATLWTLTCTIVKETIVKSRICRDSIKAISFSAHGKGLYLLDDNGKPLRNGIVSSDSRAVDLVARLKAEGVHSAAYQRSYQQLWPSHPATLLKWLKQNEPENYKNIGCVLMLHDYIRYRFTGCIACEETNFSGSQLFNPTTGQHDSELYGMFGIPELFDKQAPVIGSGAFAGEVTRQAADSTGLAAGTAVFGGLFDVVGASIASGVSDSSSISAVAGTWSISTRVFDQIEQSQYPYVWGKYCIDGKYFVHEGSPTSANNLAWFVKELFDQQCHDYDYLEQAVTRSLSSGEPNNIVFHPYLYGSNLHSSLGCSLIGVTSNHSRDDLLLAIYQGIVFSHLVHQDRIADIGPQPQRIRFGGGPTNSPAWMQLFCDASGLPVERVVTKQVGCMAAAVTAAVGFGHYSGFEQAISMIPDDTRVFTPSKKAGSTLRRKYKNFLKLAELLGNNSLRF